MRTSLGYRKDNISSSSSSSYKSGSPKPDKGIKALVGKACPGCGSPFQTTRPKDPGYVTRTIEVQLDSGLPSNAPLSTSNTSPTPKYNPAATTMSNAQYEAHLRTLDPKILEEMGLASSTGTTDLGYEQITAPETGTGSIDAEAPPLIDKKPNTKVMTPARVICHRCHSLLHHASPLANSSELPSVLFPAPTAPLPKHIETLARSKAAVVVLVVDLIDFPLSLPEPVITALLKHQRLSKSEPWAGRKPYPITPIIVVANKFDVMPVGTQKRQVVEFLRQYLEEHGLDGNIQAIHAVSAKNPVGDEIQMVLKSVATAWRKSQKGSVVMVGAENVGKSQLLNAFLAESGRWRTNTQQIQREKLGVEQTLRQRKLSQLLGDNVDGGDGDFGDKEWAAMTGKDAVGADMDQYQLLFKNRAKSKFDKHNTVVSNVPGTTLGPIRVPLSVLSRYLDADYKEMSSKYLMDTPGIRNSEGELTSWLTLDELKVTLPKKMFKPASFTLEEGKSFFLGGLVRIDCISIGRTSTSHERRSNPAPKLTVFTTLPLHKTSTVNADKFHQMTAGSQLTILQPPFGSPERLAAFPLLEPISKHDTVIINNPKRSNDASTAASTSVPYDPFSRLGDDGRDKHDRFSTTTTMSRGEQQRVQMQLAGQYGISDLVFSGIGWVMVSGKFRGSQEAVRLRIWTPKGQGAAVRERCLLPELAANPVDKTAGGIRQKHKIFQPLPIPTPPNEDVRSREATDESEKSV
ncbi:nitric oxide associated protein 1 [Dissophora globulifera]|uniref:Nitric oxide associated protein 1 n=1 Tax=Dissophora globulifera TaxID=979702 RepID=A0A9P6UYY2_9FUNG|nr:nitric oxide associated protein 1 [Dissophora globulifera]